MFVKVSEHRWHALRGYLVEMSTVVLGILIALALGAVMERRAERRLAAEAAQQIEGEMASNKKDLDGALASYPATRRQLSEAVKVIGQLIHDAETGTHSKDLKYSLSRTTIGLSAAAMTTAQNTGALRYMTYDDARRYADVYSLQQLFSRNNDRLNDEYMEIAPMDDMGEPTASDWQAMRARLATVTRYLSSVEHYGKALSRMYADNIRPH